LKKYLNHPRQKNPKKAKDLQVLVKPAVINDEIRELYANYRDHIHFITSDQCDEYLHAPDTINPFDSWMIDIRDAGRLIAVGYFDKGSNAIAGILNFYHPDYQSYSLGKLLILQKLDHARTCGCQYYYTGYLSTATEKFDYKLFPDIKAIEVYLPIEQRWAPFVHFGKDGLEDYVLRMLMG